MEVGRAKVYLHIEFSVRKRVHSKFIRGTRFSDGM